MKANLGMEIQYVGKICECALMKKGGENVCVIRGRKRNGNGMGEQCVWGEMG